MTTVEDRAVEDREQARIDGLLAALRDAETEFRRSYFQVLERVAEVEAEKVGAAAGFGTTARLLSGVLNLSRSEARARTEHAELLTPRRSLTGETLPPALPATAAGLAAGAIGPTHVRVITAAMRRIPDGIHPETATQAEQTLASAACRFDPAALGQIAERLLAHLDPDGAEPAEEPETVRELRVRTGAEGVVSLTGKLDPEGGTRVLEVLGSLNGRRPPVDGVPDQRSPARRNADALVEAMTSLLSTGRLQVRTTDRAAPCPVVMNRQSAQGAGRLAAVDAHRIFHELVGELDYSMFIVTVRDGDRRAGCLVGFATQSSIDPPRFLICLSRKNHTYQVAQHADLLAVHVVPHDAAALAELFGGRTGDEVNKFAHCEWYPGLEDIPILRDCGNWFAGRVLERLDLGDHVGFLLDPVQVQREPSESYFAFRRAKCIAPGQPA